MITIGRNLQFMVQNGLIEIKNPNCQVSDIFKALTTNGIPNCVGLGEDVDLSEHTPLGKSSDKIVSSEEKKKQKIESFEKRGGKKIIGSDDPELLKKLQKRKRDLEGNN